MRPSLLAAALVAVLAACASGEQPEPIKDTNIAVEVPKFEVVPASFPAEAPNLFDIWGTGIDNLWVCGEKGAVWQYDGARWIEHHTGATEDLRSISGEPDGPIYAVGARGTIVRYFEGIWAVEPYPTILGPDGVTELPPADLNDVVAVVGAREALAVGTGGRILYRAYESPWTDNVSGTVETLNAVIAQPGWAVVVGNLGMILRLRGGGWQRQRVDGLTVPLQSLWGVDADNFYIGGLDGTLLRAGAGDSITQLPGAPQVYLRDLWGTSMDDLWMVGWGGTILHSDGLEVTTIGEFTDRRLEGVWGTLLDPPTQPTPDGGTKLNSRYFVVGVSGTVLAGP